MRSLLYLCAVGAAVNVLSCREITDLVNSHVVGSRSQKRRIVRSRRPGLSSREYH